MSLADLGSADALASFWRVTVALSDAAADYATATSASTSATARDAANLTAALTLPSDFQQDGQFWEANNLSGNPASQPAIVANSIYSFPTVSDIGKVMQVTTGVSSSADFLSIGVVPVRAGRTYRITARFRLASAASGTPSLQLYGLFLDSGYNYFDNYSNSVTATTSWQTLTRDIDGSNATSLGAIYMRPLARSVGAGNTFQYQFVKVEDITESISAAASASAAATSASSAAASQTAAGSSASSAATSATNAATQASNASTSAGQASTSATNAAGSASAAASSATTAASAQGVLVNNMGYQHFTSSIGTKGWGYNNDGTGDLSSYAFVTPAWGDGEYLYRRADTNLSIFSTQTYPVNPNRKYKFSAEFGAYADGIDDGTTKATFYIGFVGLDNTGTMVSHGSYGSYRYSVTVGEQLYDGQKVTRSTIVTGSGNDSWSKFPPGTTQVRLMAYLNYTNVALASYLKYITIEDVTDSEAAAGSASAAATSASAASASASGASGSATSATNSANTATTQAGNAASSASSAASSASSASGSASAAASSATLSAAVNTGSLNPNPTFSQWSNPSNPPDFWSWHYNTGGPTMTRVAGTESQGFAIQAVVPAGAQHEIYNLAPASVGWYFLEADIELVSGDWTGSSIRMYGMDSAGNYASGADFQCRFDTEIPVGYDKPVGPTPSARRYNFRKLFQCSNPSVARALIAVGGGGVWATKPATGTVKIYRAGIRSANDAEVAGYQSLAEVKVIAGAVADIQGRQSAYWQTGAAVGGSSASASITVRADSVTPAASPMTPVLTGATFRGRRAQRTTGPAADWDYGVVSVEDYTSGAYASATAGETTSYKMFGLSSAATSTIPYYGYINYAIYLSGDGSVQIYEGGAGYSGFGTYTTNDQFSVEYSNASGGTVIYKRNGTEFLGRTGVGTGQKFRFIASLYSLGGSFDNVVFAPSGPSTTSSVLIAAQEFAVANGSGTSSKLALRVVNGDAAFSGNIYAGGKIIMGNGNTGWDVAVKPKIIQVTDGQSVSWANLGYTPNYTFDTTGLAPLGTGETYNLYLDSLSATGATVRCKINVPGTPASYNLTTDAAGGGANPARIMSKGGNPDASGGSYRFQGTWSVAGNVYREDKFSPWDTDYTVNISLYAKVSGTWTTVGSYITGDTISGNHSSVTGSYDVTLTAPSGVTDFGASVDCNDITSVSWTAPGTSSGVRSASPSGETCKLSVIP